MTFEDLLDDVLAQLPAPRREAIDAMVSEFGAGPGFRFLLALLAGATARERQLVRLFLRELERLDSETAA
jgi:hypothetical protein